MNSKTQDNEATESATWGLGLDVETGEYLPAPANPDALAAALRQAEDTCRLETHGLGFRGTSDDVLEPEDTDVKDLSASAWGVIFAADTDPEVRDALRPLLDHRKARATQYLPEGYREFWGDDALRPWESKARFLQRFEAPAYSTVIPEAMPYYLLLVGDLDQIPLSFQYALDVEYAVGRIHFDEPEQYANYAQTVIEAEARSARSSLPRTAFFAPQHKGDKATAEVIEHLIEPLVRWLNEHYPDLPLDVSQGPEATRERLLNILNNDPQPLLFTAGHGLAISNQNPTRQRAEQGAMICQDWPGPGTGPIPRSAYVTRDDLSPDADLAGMILFQLACFSAATPAQDDFKTLAPEYLSAGQAFLSPLIQALLGRPNGVQAVIGHVDRIWMHSIVSEKPTLYDQRIFGHTLKRLLEGFPVGYAVEPLNRLGAEKATRVAELLYQQRLGDHSAEQELARIWIAHRDARNYIVLGDPAVTAVLPGSP